VVMREQRQIPEQRPSVAETAFYTATALVAALGNAILLTSATIASAIAGLFGRNSRKNLQQPAVTTDRTPVYTLDRWSGSSLACVPYVAGCQPVIPFAPCDLSVGLAVDVHIEVVPEGEAETVFKDIAVAGYITGKHSFT
jgi:hypothetical protein